MGEADVSSVLRVDALGGLRIGVAGRDITHEVPVKAAALMAYVVDAGRPVPRTELAGLLWSDLPEDRARANLRLALTRIRAVIRPDLGTDRHRVWLRPEVRYDVALLESGEAEAVLTHYSGDFLAGIEPGGAGLFADWLVTRRHSLRSTALLRLHAALERGRGEAAWTRVLTVAVRVLEIEPWDEAAHRGAIMALVHTRGRAAALAQFDRCARILEGDLGVGPEPATVALANRIREAAHLEPEPDGNQTVGRHTEPAGTLTAP